MSTYKLTILKGTVGDLVTEWMSPEERKIFQEEHAKYVAELKEKGEYLKPVEVIFEISHNPLFDDRLFVEVPHVESYKMDILDLSKPKKL